MFETLLVGDRSCGMLSRPATAIVSQVTNSGLEGMIAGATMLSRPTNFE
jgi:hypothetical protein